MKSIISAVFLLTWFQIFSLSTEANILGEDELRYAQAAFVAAEAGRWKDAHAHASRHKLVAKILKWMDYVRPETRTSFTEIAAFVRGNPDWPQLAVLIQRAEDTITPTESTVVLQEWFRAHPPLTPNGKMAWAQVLLDMNHPDQAVAVVRESWVNDSFGPVQEKHFLTIHGHRLRSEDHVARLDRLLWDRQTDAARRMLLKVDASQKILAEVRILLANDKTGASTALTKVPTELRNTPGLVYECVRWRRRKEMHLEAISLLSGLAADKVRPSLWWAERVVLAREALALGQTVKAYEVARTHGKLTGVQLAGAEWLAGWIALRWLKDARRAYPHFTRLYEGVATPISLSRAAYWAGRATEAMGRKEEATQWYRKAAVHVTSYYGQLAASRLSDNPIRSLPEDPLPTPADIEVFNRHELVSIVTLLTEIGQREAIRPFVFRLSELAKTPGQHTLAAKLAINASRPDIAVALARRLIQSEVILTASGYPLLRLRTKAPPEHALLLSVIRQESNFHAGAVSRAGAQGLMQLMPMTARQMASRQNIGFTASALMTDPEYNIRLGTAFLEDLLDSFRGSYVLTIAAYNAGSSRVERWMRIFGDPRRSVDDAVDWIESIPFSETRNYVQRVLESIQIYRRRLGTTELRLSLENDLQR